MINLISDTVTKPTPAMLEAMMTADVGDDVFGEDPTVNKLQTIASEMFGKEAAIFCPSGTMTNQIAIKAHTQALDEVICEESSHVYQYEVGGYAFHSGVAINPIKGQFGKITSQQIELAIKPDFDWLPNTKLVVLENSTNKGGGNFYTLDEIKLIQERTINAGLKLHLDGARLFNVLVETLETPLEVGQYFDSISICLSKGLGAPVGSLLIGNRAFIKRARKIRKVMGGGMRQAGYLAAAGIYALNNNIERLKIDNDRAKFIGQLLQKFSLVDEILPVRTNIVIFKIVKKVSAIEILTKLDQSGIKASLFGENSIRFVFHLNISDDDILELEHVLSKILK